MELAKSYERPKRQGISKKALLILGFSLLFLGVVGKGVLENTFLKDSSLSTEREMAIATAAIVLQALSTASMPAFVYFLIGEMEKKSNARGTVVVLFLISLACEIPYNIVLSGRLADEKSRNPVFALFLCAVVLAAFGKFGGTKISLVVKAATVTAALFWAAVLSVKWGLCAVVLCTVLKTFRKKEPLDLLFGSAVLSAFGMLSPYYMIAPFSLVLMAFLRQR